MKVGLGTAQFGFDYGISNSLGRVSITEIRRILDMAAEKAVRVIDTASLYGISEHVLGQCLDEHHKFCIVTKTPQYSKPMITEEDGDRLKSVFAESLQELKQSSIYGLIIHNADDLLAGNGFLLWEAMNTIKKEGLVRKIGASFYSAGQIDAILKKYSLDLVQLPLNVLDQRLINSGHLEKLKKLSIEIHVRSVFLQGLLLMNPDDLPEYFESVRAHLKRYHRFVAKRDVPPLLAALCFAQNFNEIDAIIIGVVNSAQLSEIFEACEKVCTMAPNDYRNFAWDDEAILNPSRWKVSRG